MPAAPQHISANLASVHVRIAEACERAGRAAADVRLVAVTKSVDLRPIRALREMGVRDLGESRPRQLAERAGQFPDVTWHQVGRVQRNKLRKLLPCADWIHSVDRERLVHAIAQEHHRAVAHHNLLGESAPAIPKLLVEVNVAREDAKTGLSPDGLEAVLAACAQENLAVEGLMTMAPWDVPEAARRRVFASLRALRDKALERGWARALPELSMGMTDDFEEAVLEGATIVRIGRALFAEVTV